MLFKSDAQRRFMYAKHPKIAARWSNAGLEDELVKIADVNNVADRSTR